jgi:hypothetical protein
LFGARTNLQHGRHEDAHRAIRRERHMVHAGPRHPRWRPQGPRGGLRPIRPVWAEGLCSRNALGATDAPPSFSRIWRNTKRESNDGIEAHSHVRHCEDPMQSEWSLSAAKRAPDKWNCRTNYAVCWPIIRVFFFHSPTLARRYFSSSALTDSQSGPGGRRASSLARSRNSADGGSASAERAKWSAAPAKSRTRKRVRPST